MIFQIRNSILINLNKRRSNFLCPRIGDIVILKYFHFFKGKISYFGPQLVIGRCISVRKKKGFGCSIILRNAWQKTSFELLFFLNSPLMIKYNVIPQKYAYNFKKSKLYFYRRKKVSKSLIKVL